MNFGEQSAIEAMLNLAYNPSSKHPAETSETTQPHYNPPTSQPVTQYAPQEYRSVDTSAHVAMYPPTVDMSSAMHERNFSQPLPSLTNSRNAEMCRPKAMRLSQILSDNTEQDYAPPSSQLVEQTQHYSYASAPMYINPSPPNKPSQLPATEPLTPPFSPPLLPPLKSMLSVPASTDMRVPVATETQSMEHAWSQPLVNHNVDSNMFFKPQPKQELQLQPHRQISPQLMSQSMSPSMPPSMPHSLPPSMPQAISQPRPQPMPQPVPQSTLQPRSQVKSEPKAQAKTAGRKALVPYGQSKLASNDASNRSSNSSRRIAKRPYKKYYANPTPSSHCHVCARTSKAVKFAVCARIAEGLCRKVTCYKCFLAFGWDWEAAKNSTDWICVHCRGECPEGRSQCYIYSRVNSKRESKRNAKKKNAKQAALKAEAVAMQTKAGTISRINSPSEVDTSNGYGSRSGGGGGVHGHVDRRTSSSSGFQNQLGPAASVLRMI